MAEEQTLSKADELVAQVETGARNPAGWQAYLIPGICFIWALYQLYIASSLPSWLTQTTGIDIFLFVGNLSISRKVHLIFALVLATMAYPLFKSSARNHIPAYDWAILALGAASILYMIGMNSNIAERGGRLCPPQHPLGHDGGGDRHRRADLCRLPLAGTAAGGGGRDPCRIRLCRWRQLGRGQFRQGHVAFLDAGRGCVRQTAVGVGADDFPVRSLRGDPRKGRGG